MIKTFFISIGKAIYFRVKDKVFQKESENKLYTTGNKKAASIA
ncbi:hypothetical protein AQPE_2218 [Aquipluma nitroreducens]|uniref:Uncharacterized protein n=1 Tax=Aquipluma nitroreducens TaxID=2010828 RepID=A0A5K7S916_9BACT|nr:hypothetical protein AQPE_2218 [Aquipluma nitroreducens]